MALTNDDLLAISQLLDSKLNESLKPINSRLDKVDSRLDKVDSRLDKVDSRLDKVDSRLDKIDSRLDKVESEISALKVGQRAIKDRVTDTYNLALEAWGQSTENRHWLEKNENAS